MNPEPSRKIGFIDFKSRLSHLVANWNFKIRLGQLGNIIGIYFNKNKQISLHIRIKRAYSFRFFNPLSGNMFFMPLERESIWKASGVSKLKEVKRDEPEK